MKPRYLIIGATLSAQIWSMLAFAQSPPPELVHYPEFIFFDGQVLTADSDRDFTITEAVAVRGNRIFALGSNQKIKRLAGPGTRQVDLRGRSLTPGFIYNDGDNAVPAGDILKDTQWGGRTYPRVGGKTIEEALATLAFIVRNEGNPGEPIFFNLSDSWSGPAGKQWDISTLDEIAPSTPMIVYLESSEGLVNSAMIELAFNEGFPEDHIHIDRDENGDFTGRVGAQFTGFVGREIRPWPNAAWFDEVAMPNARDTLTRYARHGVTLATGHMSAPTMTLLNRLFHENGGSNLAIRVYPGLDFLRQNPEGEKYLKRMGNLVDFSLTDDRGAMVTIVGASVGPHSGTPDGATGLLTIEPKTNIVAGLNDSMHGYNRWTAEWFTGLGHADLTAKQKAQTDYHNVLLARRHGWNVTGIHNMGSEGIRLAMQYVVEAEQQENLYVKQLWRPQGFDHNIDWTPEVFEYYESHPELKDLIRFGVSLRNVINQRGAKELGLVQVVELQHGMEGLERLAPLRSLLEHGVPFHIEGTEPKDDVAYPTWYLQRAVTRVDSLGRVIAEDQTIDRMTALLALTRWAARFIGADDELGSIEVGKLADLVVFDGNILDAAIEELDQIKPVLTMVGGKVAFEASGF